MINLLTSASNGDSSKTHTFFLNGDLSQMSIQKNFLSRRGFSIQQNDVYPCLKPEDTKEALKAIWENRIEGWWHYKDKYVELGICQKEDFDKRLQAS